MSKKNWLFFVTVVLILGLNSLAVADDTRTSGLYTYTIKGNGTITITHFDWVNNSGTIYVPSMIDGYTVTGIGNNAFDADDISTYMEPVIIVLPETLTSIGSKAFYEAPIISIDIPSSVQSIGEGAFAKSKVSKFGVAPHHEYFAVIDGVLYEKRTKKLIAFPRNAESVESIPNGIVEIGAYAFADRTIKASSMNTFLPESIVTIGDYAFQNTCFNVDEGKWEIKAKTVGDYAFESISYYGGSPVEITVNAETVGKYAFADIYLSHIVSNYKLVVGNKVKSIGDYGFAATSETLYRRTPIDYSTAENLQTIGKYAFSNNRIERSSSGDILPHGMSELPEGVFENALSGENWLHAQESIIIPDSVTVIGERAFANNPKIKEIVLSEGLLEIGSCAFTGCESLKSIVIPNSVQSIQTDSFDRSSVVFIVTPGSYIEFWAKENGFTYKYTSEESADDLSWLNN